MSKRIEKSSIATWILLIRCNIGTIFNSVDLSNLKGQNNNYFEYYPSIQITSLQHVHIGIQKLVQMNILFT